MPEAKFKTISVMLSDYKEMEKVRMLLEKESVVPVSMPQLIKVAVVAYGDKLATK